MNFRKKLYFGIVNLRGQALGANYKRFLREIREGIPVETTKQLLVRLLTHCQQSVPYYAQIMEEKACSYKEDPEEYLRSFPILTKDIIRNHFDGLKSQDLSRRKWYFNTSGGSTGEPVRFIQDWDYAARMGAIKLLYSQLAGKELGETEVNLWGSARDLSKYYQNWKAIFMTKLANITPLDAYKMTPEAMREYVKVINTRRPKQIVAYADALYMLANFAERERLQIVPQQSIITSACVLDPAMREKIEKIFRCRVFDRYGSREVSDIACERPGFEGLWVAPWGNYLEIVDKDGNPVPDGTEGEILVTSLTNFAMPLIRYQIGDLGILAHRDDCKQDPGTQILQSVLGRKGELFRTKDGALVHGAYFRHMLFYRSGILRYQAIQKSYSHIVYRIVRSKFELPQTELDDIVSQTRRVMGDDCEVNFEFVDEISASASGKYRYVISEIEEAR